MSSVLSRVFAQKVSQREVEMRQMHKNALLSHGAWATATALDEPEVRGKRYLHDFWTARRPASTLMFASFLEAESADGRSLSLELAQEFSRSGDAFLSLKAHNQLGICTGQGATEMMLV